MKTLFKIITIGALLLIGNLTISIADEKNFKIDPENKSYKLILNKINPNFISIDIDDDKKSVVLIEYPRKGVWAVGFATKENTSEMVEKTNKKLINVFVPTTPNPTSGFLLMFPIEDVIYLNMSFEEASKFIVSAGTSNKQS